MSSNVRLVRALLCRACQLQQVPSRCNSNKTAITRTNRTKYIRQYPTTLMQSDGSTITIRYEKPRRVIVLPVNLSELTEAERKARLLKRRPKQKFVLEDDFEDDYDANRYSHLWKKK